MRIKEEEYLKKIKRGEALEEDDVVDLSFEGHGVLIVAQETVDDEIPLCMGLGNAKNKVGGFPTKYISIFFSLLFFQ